MQIKHIMDDMDNVISSTRWEKRFDPVENIFTEYVILKFKCALQSIMGADQEKILSTEDAYYLITLHDDFFKVIQQSDQIAPHSPNSLLTAVLLNVATNLEKVINICKYQILIPTLKITNYLASSTCLNDPDLAINSFVLNDDGSAIIEVYNSLSQAVNDGCLKYTFLINNQAMFLTHPEQNRVLNHSPLTKSYWQAIQKRIDVTRYSESFGSALHRLSEALRNGGSRSKRGGVEYNSGIDATLGIFYFFDWYNNNLTNADRAKILAIDGLSGIFNDLTRAHELERIGTKNDVEVADGRVLNDTKYCVELIADRINTILINNKNLYNSFPENIIDNPHEQINNAEAQLKETEKNLITALKTDSYKVNSSYGPEAYFRFAQRVGAIRDLVSIIGPEQLGILCPADMLKNKLSSIEESDRLKLIVYLQPILLSIPHFDLQYILILANCLPTFDAKLEFFSLFAQKVCSFINNAEDLHNLLNNIDEEIRESFLIILYEAKPQVLLLAKVPYAQILIKLITIHDLNLSQAIDELEHLNSTQISTLETLYDNGLRGSHLRTFKPATNGSFTELHAQVLGYLITVQDFDPLSAVKLIDRKTGQQALIVQQQFERPRCTRLKRRLF